MPAFKEFYRAINRRDPFPWQARLARQVAETEKWCSDVGIPTGLGKTACLDIAVWWLASQADRVPSKRTAPTRVWWVVSRQLLVDATYEHADKIRELLRDPDLSGLSERDREVVKAVADRLRSIAAKPNAEPLEVIRLRSGVASRRPIDPSQPAILLSTLPLYGSRLLFRGLGTTQSMRAVDAAMAGTDSLVFLDEAHSARHLRALCTATAECFPHAHPIPGPIRSRPCVVSLTTTGDSLGKQRFSLDDEDREHRIVRKRLDAAKFFELRVEDRYSENCLVKAAHDVLESAEAPATCLVFVNTPTFARKVFSRLLKRMPNAEVLLVTGRIREWEAVKTRSRILDPHSGMAAPRETRSRRQRHFIVVATQTLEVGANIDADYLVTEQCGVRALTQRLGRLNRFGRYEQAHAVYVHMPAPKSKSSVGEGSYWPVYGTEPENLLGTLERFCHESASGRVNLTPGRVAELLGPPSDTAGRAPEVLPGILWEWTKTSKPPEGEAPVEPYFSGIRGAQRLVSLLWRAHIPDPDQHLWPRPKDHEAIDIPIAEFRSVLKDHTIFRIRPDGITIEETSVSSVKPGDQVVLPTDCGLIDEFGWNPDARGPVLDVSLIGSGLPLDATAIERICGIVMNGQLLNRALNDLPDGEEIEPKERTQAVEEILELVSEGIAHGWDPGDWQEFVESLSTRVIEARNEVPRLQIKGPVTEELSPEFDEMSLAGAVDELDTHCEAVAIRAREISGRIGIQPGLVDVLERAGRLHDIGKADRRFQRWLSPSGTPDVLLAKSGARRHQWAAMRVASGWPRGGRHEELSARLVRNWLAENPDWGDPVKRSLLVHLVRSHHGKGRPLVRPVVDNTSGSVNCLIKGMPVRADANLEVVDWSQPSRFWNLNEHFGPWGLALLEAVVMLSDQSVSMEARAISESDR